MTAGNSDREIDTPVRDFILLQPVELNVKPSGTALTATSDSRPAETCP